MLIRYSSTEMLSSCLKPGTCTQVYLRLFKNHFTKVARCTRNISLRATPSAGWMHWHWTRFSAGDMQCWIHGMGDKVQEAPDAPHHTLPAILHFHASPLGLWSARNWPSDVRSIHNILQSKFQKHFFVLYLLPFMATIIFGKSFKFGSLLQFRKRSSWLLQIVILN